MGRKCSTCGEMNTDIAKFCSCCGAIMLTEDGTPVGRSNGENTKTIEVYPILKREDLWTEVEGERILTEYAQSWIQVSVESRGMAMTDNYSVKIRRTEDGRLLASGAFYVNGAPKIYGKNQATTGIGMQGMQAQLRPEDTMELLPEEMSRRILEIPFGMLDSSSWKAFGTPCCNSGMGVGVLADRGPVQGSVTYSDGRVDNKIVDLAVAAQLRDIFCS